MTSCTPPVAPGRRLAAALVLAAAALAGCTGFGQTVCPAIGWSDELTVALADGWPAGPGRTVHLVCSQPCGPSSPSGGGGTDGEVSLPLRGTSTTFGLMMTAPEGVVVSVRDAAGTELARVEAEPDWVRVGGTAECGGPHEATVTVPAP